ncbi:MAG: S-layer homology domain-containing protein [Peptostreptococcaceae bacterium]|nr:S-layer homology domain-containing protein [Peptostreptococcaceae bacterium]
MHKQTKRWISTLLAMLMLCSTVFSNSSLVHASEFGRPISTTDTADAKQSIADSKSNASANPSGDANAATPLNFDNLVLQAKVEENKLIIFSTAANAKDFFAKVKTIHVNEVRFDPIKEFDVVENQIVFHGNPARFMKNEIKVTLDDGDEKDLIFDNPDGKPFNHGLEIVGVELDKQGDPAAGVVSEYVKMSLDSEYDSKELHATIKHLKGVSIDDLDYPMRDDKGMIVFILSNGALGIYDQYPIGKEAVADFKLRDKHKVVFTFEDDSKTVYEDDGYVKPDRGNTPPPTPPPPKVGIAKEYDIKEVITKKGWGDEELLVTFDKKLTFPHSQGIKNIKVNGKDFGRPADLGINYDGQLRTANAQVVAHAKTKTPIEFEITFGDDSVLVYVPSAPAPDDFNLDSNFADGSYTLTLKNYKVGSSEKSDYDNILDPRAKLYVANGKKKISFLLHTDAKDYADFAIKANNDFESMHPVVLKSDGNGDPIAVEYIVDMSNLKGKKLSALLSVADEAKKGQFDDPSYKKFDIEFDYKVTKGFTNYKFFDAPAPTGDAALIKALIDNGLDTDNDKKISIDELKNAVGKDKPANIDIPGYPGKNTLNLGNYGISDISLLKHLGPKIKAINLDSNKLTSLPADVFENATGVSHILLGGNKIAKIEPKTFDNLSALRYLDFDGSLLEELPKGLFDKNKDLRVLSLMNNKLKSLPDDLLKNNTKLEELYLLDNALTDLSDGFFSTNKELKALHIYNNRLENLPDLSAATKIKVITAQGNLIKKIPDSWGKLKQIERLDLENNRIESVPAKLLSNMITYAKYTPTVSLDLTQNNLKTLPLDEMSDALANGKALSKFEVNLNMLAEKPSADEINKMKKLGIEFEKAVDIYYPQKTSMQSIAKGENQKIELNQALSVLELFYWDLGDSPRYGGKAEFSDRDDFIKYMAETGRDVNGVERSLSREDGIKAILEKKNLEWEVETKIIKNDTQEVYNKREKANPKEALTQTFDEPNMADGDKYKIYKTMYLKSFNGFTVKLENITEFTAGKSTPQPPVEREIPAKLLTPDGKEYSFANEALKSVHVKTLDKKSSIKMAEFTFEFDKVKAGGQSSDVSAFEVQLKNKPMKAKELSAGKFSIENFAHLVKPPTETKDTKWKVFVTTKDALPNHEKRTEMLLILDWNGDFKLDGGSVLPQEGALRITNLDKKNNEPLTGAKFKLSGGGKEITKTVIDAKGTLLFDKLAIGEYKVTQTVAPKGYKLNSEEKTFTVVKDQTGEITIYNEKDDGSTPPPSPPPSGGGSGGGSGGSGGSGGRSSQRPDSTTTITDNQTPLAQDPNIAKIEKLLNEGYMSGYPGNKFMPNRNMTRAEIAAMLDRLIDEQPTEAKSFSDIKADAWYAKSLAKIASLGYIRPNGDKIQPEKPITRAEFAYIIAKLRKLEEGANMPKDVNSNHWAAKEIAACVKAGIISGYKDGSFKPEQPITRAEVVSMMSRAFNIQPKASTRADYIDVKKNHWAYNVIMASSQS